MHTNRTLLVAAMTAVLMVSGCGQDGSADADAVDAAPAAPAADTTDVDTPPATGPIAADEDAEAIPFDVATVPISEAALGEWPYVAAPEGYALDDTRTLDLARVPFWTGQMLQFVEGKVFEARIGETGEKTYSGFEVLKRFDETLGALGAQKITTSDVPGDVINADLPKNFGSDFYAGAGGYYGNQEVSTYVLRQADRVVWFKVFSDNSNGSLLIAESDAVPDVTAPAAP